MDSIKINQLEIENVKRVKAVTLTPTSSGLTVIGGKNNQGKTSILDAIAWALGGDKFRPSNPVRQDSMLPPRIKITLSNGLLVERSGKNSALKVIDPEGRKSGQQLLNEFVEALALDLPRFLGQSNKEKAETLLKVIGLADQVHALEQKEQDLYNRRRVVGQEADRKKKHAESLPTFPGAPLEPVSPSELIRRQQDILARNGENQRKRDRLREITAEKQRLSDDIERLLQQKQDLEQRIAERKEAYSKVAQDEAVAQRDAADLRDESTEELERDLANVEKINIQVRANLDREQAEEEAARYDAEYRRLTGEIEQARSDKFALLEGAALPLEGLGVDGGELTYLGRAWDCMSGSDQLRAATAIVRAINPKCGFVLLDKLEQMDLDTLREFSGWLEAQGLQAIATRVSTGGECSIIIEDGHAAEDGDTPFIAAPTAPVPTGSPKWQKGVF